MRCQPQILDCVYFPPARLLFYMSWIEPWNQEINSDVLLPFDKPGHIQGGMAEDTLLFDPKTPFRFPLVARLLSWQQKDRVQSTYIVFSPLLDNFSVFYFWR